MSIPSQQNEEIERLFQKHVPEVAAGIVELVSIEREAGKELWLQFAHGMPRFIQSL